KSFEARMLCFKAVTAAAGQSRAAFRRPIPASRCRLPLQGKILEMLRQRMPSGLQNENLVAVGLVGIEQMPRQHAVKAPDDDGVESRASPCAWGRVLSLSILSMASSKPLQMSRPRMSWVKSVSCAVLPVAMSASDFPGRDPLRTEQQQFYHRLQAYGSIF